MKRKISITLEEETILAILGYKDCSKSEFIERAVERFLNEAQA